MKKAVTLICQAIAHLFINIISIRWENDKILIQSVSNY
ncbi:hypothetical protein RintRC_6587 [Richelia intracellularis]|nr:hypothetical protein RintRC_6587 [Richelia intracellularis]